MDALLETGTPNEEIYYKTVKKFSLKTILDEDVKKRWRRDWPLKLERTVPRLSLEPASLNFGEVKSPQGKVSAIFKLWNKGERGFGDH